MTLTWPKPKTLLRGFGLALFPAFTISLTWRGHHWPLLALMSLLVPAGMVYARYAGGVLSHMDWRDAAGMAAPEKEWHAIAGLTVAVLAGDAMMFVNGDTPGYVATMAVVPWALARISWPRGVVFALVAGAILVAMAFYFAGGWPAVGLGTGVAGSGMIGLLMRDARQKVGAAQQLVESERATRAATSRADALAERQRMAREIHDILAHTLTAQVVQLEGARMLLKRGAPGGDVLARVEQAQRLARDGVEETRRALESLRSDARPLPELLAGLAAQSDAQFTVAGAPRPVPPEAGLALERTAREALTNARKHAAGAHVAVALTYADDAVEVEISDGGSGSPHPELGGSGGGYGLAGMRERAELLGGALSAGPRADGKGYRVWLRVPNCG